MINPLGSSQFSQTSVLAEAQKHLPLQGSPGFPMNNLITLAQDVLAPSATASQQRISLTSQSFANIITNSVIKAVQSVISTFMDRIMQLMSGLQGSRNDGSPLAGGTSGSSGVGASSGSGVNGTEEASGSSDVAETQDPTESEKSGGILDTAKDYLGKIADFFYGDKGGVGEIFKDIVTTFLPGAGALNIGTLLKKFKGAGKVLKGLLKSGKGTLGKLFKKGKNMLSKLWESGKSLFSKIF